MQNQAIAPFWHSASVPQTTNLRKHALFIPLGVVPAFDNQCTELLPS